MRSPLHRQRGKGVRGAHGSTWLALLKNALAVWNGGAPVLRSGNRIKPMLMEKVAVFAKSAGSPRFRDDEGWAYLCLSVLTLVVFLPVAGLEFISLDDPSYVMKNPHVSTGISLANVGWAFGALHAKFSYWHPLTWISHQLDCQLFGLRPGPHHLTNLVLHLVAGLLLLRFLGKATGEWVPSAVVACLFSVHPLHVETVAWVAERKGVLSGLAWMATLNAYLWYSRAPRPGRYGAVLAGSLAALASKPSAVMLPVALLVLDYWPLGRLLGVGSAAAPGCPQVRPMRLFLEKVPLLTLSIAVSAATCVAQRQIGAMPSLDALPLPERLDNAIMAYVFYVGKTLWPTDLSVIRTHAGAWPFWEVLLGGCGLAYVSWACLRYRPARPYLLAGWAWFVLILMPMVGLVQVGAQFIADRYSYISAVGLFVAVVWLARDLAKARPQFAGVLLTATGLVLAVAAAASRHQLRYWENGTVLLSHAVDLDRANGAAHYHLAAALSNEGAYGAACAHLAEAIRLIPNSAAARRMQGSLLLHRGYPQEATDAFKQALALDPKQTEAHYMLAVIYSSYPDPQFRSGTAAVSHALNFAKTAEPGDARRFDLLAAAFAEKGDFAQATELAQAAYALACAGGNGVEDARRRLESYRRGEPLRLTPRMGRGLFQPSPEIPPQGVPDANLALPSGGAQQRQQPAERGGRLPAKPSGGS